MFGRSEKTEESPTGLDSDRAHSMETDRTLTEGPTKNQLKRATRTRLIWSLICSFLLLLTVIFLILVEIGQTNQNQSIPNNTYFLKLDLTNIIPTSVPNASIINSLAQTLGLHDFYQVGLWGFCEGYNGEGVTYCSKPQTLYWFNPVEILLSELLAGATIALPTQVTDILDLIMTVSHWMFGLFLAGACLSFVMMFLQPISVFSRWWALIIMLFTFFAALCTTVATVVATVLFIIFRNSVTAVAEINIGASLGIRMFVFMWIAAGTSIIAWLIQLCLCCCCASRRDIKKGKKTGSKKAWNTETTGVTEKPAKRGMFGRKAQQ